MVKSEVIVYSKPNCMQCLYTKKLMSDLNIDYKEVNAIKENKIDFIKEKGFQQLPVVLIDGDWETAWSGFEPEFIEGIV